MLGSYPEGIMGAFLGGAGGPKVERNIAMGGRIATNLSGAPTGKERYQGRYKFLVFQPATNIRVVWNNRYLTANSTFENAGPADYTINKAAIEQSGSFAPLLFSGAAGKTITAGAYNQRSDRTTFNLVAGLAWVRFELDVATGANQFIFGKFYSNSTYEGANVEQGIYFAPANELDQIYGTGTLATPTGGVVGQVGPPPALLIGEVSPGVDAIIGVGDSIANAQADFPSSSGVNGDSFLKRAAYTVSKPYLSFAISGLLASQVAGASHPMLDAMIAYHRTLASELGTNDIANSFTSAQLITSLKTIWSGAKTNGIQRIIQNNLLPRVATAGAACTTLVDQTPATGFAAGGQAEIFNAALAGLVSGGFINTAVDIRSTVMDSGTNQKWAIPAFASTLAASALSSASSVSIADSPVVGNFLVFSPGGGGGVQSTGLTQVTSVSGAGPYTVALSTTLGVAQASSAAIQASQTSDGIHPVALTNAAMAVPMAAVF